MSDDAPKTYTLDTGLANDEKMLADARALVAGKEPPQLLHLLERVATLRTSALIAWIGDPVTAGALLDVQPMRHEDRETFEFKRAVVLVALGAVRDELDRRIPVPA